MEHAGVPVSAPSRPQTRNPVRAADLPNAVDLAWRERASRVLPGGMYGHIKAPNYPEGFPQFYSRSSGSRVWDVDGNEAIDLMCSWGPMILGYNNPIIDDAYRAELANRGLAYGASPKSVELAEKFVDLVEHADWAMFGKNGGDATTVATTIARAATGRSKVLKARRSYHGSTPWYTPGPAGITAEDRANIIEFTYNDLVSLEEAVALAGEDLAAIIITPHRHETENDQIAVDLAFARTIRKICDDKSAVLILDDVRSGFRVSVKGSWEPLGISPDLSCYSKCIANGYPLSAVAGIESLADAASSIYATGSFWYGSAEMAASIACLDAMVEMDATSVMNARGEQLMNGLRDQAASHGFSVVVSGPPAMPFMRFTDGKPLEYAYIWSAEALRRGALFHPFHNWFLSTAHTSDDVDRALDASDGAFGYLSLRVG
jgi:glutamate-1-semialdehyde 2,1-aminomutase